MLYYKHENAFPNSIYFDSPKKAAEAARRSGLALVAYLWLFVRKILHLLPPAVWLPQRATAWPPDLRCCYSAKSSEAALRAKGTGRGGRKGHPAVPSSVGDRIGGHHDQFGTYEKERSKGNRIILVVLGAGKQWRRLAEETTAPALQHQKGGV